MGEFTDFEAAGTLTQHPGKIGGNGVRVPVNGLRTNRRAFFERGTRLLRRSAIDHRPVTLLVCDLDRFKQINDTFGHETGDRILIAFCGVVTGVLRPTDLFSRLGGEEFACLLPRTSQPDAVAAAERIRSGFEATSVNIQGRQVRATAQAMTVSVWDGGVAMSELFGGDGGDQVFMALGAATISLAVPATTGSASPLDVPSTGERAARSYRIAALAASTLRLSGFAGSL
jgi:diguanylate cyclase (GGDEF)-like protein